MPEICDECGSDMKLVVVKKPTYKTRRIGHYACTCGFKKSYESMSEQDRRQSVEYEDTEIESEM